MKYAIIFRFTDSGLAARSADFPELTASGRTMLEVEEKLHAIIRQHIQEQCNPKKLFALQAQSS